MKVKLPGTEFVVDMKAEEISMLDAVDSLSQVHYRLEVLLSVLANLAGAAGELHFTEKHGKENWNREVFVFIKECSEILPLLEDRLELVLPVIEFVKESLTENLKATKAS